MKIAVITPYHKEDTRILYRCHKSVKEQGSICDHFMIADGYPDSEVNKWDVEHVELPFSNEDNGDTPRAIGGILAKNRQYDYISFLDADNWYLKGHLESLLELFNTTDIDIACSKRIFYDLNEKVMPYTESQEDCHVHVDTSCYLLKPSTYYALSFWSDIPNILSPICDRIFLQKLFISGFKIMSTNKRTVGFTSKYKSHYILAGIPISDASSLKSDEMFTPILAFLDSKIGQQICMSTIHFSPTSRSIFQNNKRILFKE